MIKYLTITGLFVVGACMSIFAADELLTLQQIAKLPPDVFEEVMEGNVPNELLPYLGKQVRVRGFLYSAKNGKSVIAAEPDLKSCCVGSQKMIIRQIFLECDIQKNVGAGHVATVEGVFTLDPVKDKDNQLRQLFVLQKAVLINETGSPLLLVYLLLATIALIGIAFYIFKRFQ